MTIHDEISELQKKAGKYDALKNEYDMLKEAVSEATKKLGILTGGIGVKISIDSRSNKWKNIANVLYEKMKLDDTFQITRVSVEDYLNQEKIFYAYSNISELLSIIQTFNGVHKTKIDGRSIRIFYQEPSSPKEGIKFGNVNVMG